MQKSGSDHLAVLPTPVCKFLNVFAVVFVLRITHEASWSNVKINDVTSKFIEPKWVSVMSR